ncbi:hypothetical protein AALP_AA7G032700 [Arabis alpina]|uniref:Pentatricopeptide repeat-containing protein n=1 Tax=Arabis alpina TaxID=50452 RepID=A0A087GFM9_ARAAL|nr:hypothetical protein AALP_AA7G032700 [Arabis alpina]
MFRTMCKKGVQVDSVCLSNILSICAPREECDYPSETYRNVLGTQIHSIALRLGFVRDLHLNNSLLEVYAKNKDMNGAELIFAEMPEVNVVSLNIMIAGFGQEYRSDKSIEYLTRMRDSGFEPNEVTCTSVLGACFCSGDVETGRRIFSSMPHPSVSVWNGMLSGYSKYEHYEEALNHFRHMQFQNLKPDSNSLSVILSSCARLRYLEGGKQIHGVLKSGYVSDSFVETALTDMYCKCGETDSARQFFDTVLRKNTVIWNEMIHGYAHNGRGDEAVELYREMISLGEKPDGITFVSVLTACSHSRLVETGLEILSSMQRDHGIEPELDHYICIVDCLGRAGRLDDAEALADATPYKSSSVLWEILLSSCRVHGNVSMARRLFKD